MPGQPEQEVFLEVPGPPVYDPDCAIRDPFGNHIRITEPKPMPAEGWSEAAAKA